MASSDLERNAREAFIDDHFELVVDLYTQAIALSPTATELFADRAQANIKLQNFTDAVADINKAIELDHSMAKADLRKDVACIKLEDEEYQIGKAALETGASLFSGYVRILGFPLCGIDSYEVHSLGSLCMILCCSLFGCLWRHELS